jgi:hypothetical protein
VCGEHLPTCHEIDWEALQTILNVALVDNDLIQPALGVTTMLTAERAKKLLPLAELALLRWRYTRYEV